MSRRGGLLWALTLRCRTASELLSKELDEPLDGMEWLGLRGHLISCRSCRRFRRQIRWIRMAIRNRDQSFTQSGAEDAALSEEARRRIARAIQEAEAEPDST